MITRQDGVSTIKGLQYDNTPRWRVHNKRAIDSLEPYFEQPIPPEPIAGDTKQ